MNCKRWLRIAACTAALVLLFSGVAVAQDQDQQQAQAEAPDQGAKTLEDVVKGKFTGEVTVTASRREVNVRELPSSVVVTEGADLESIGVTTMDDYVYQVPGVNYMDAAPQRDVVSIRGIASSPTSFVTQQPVGTYINEARDSKITLFI